MLKAGCDHLAGDLDSHSLIPRVTRFLHEQADPRAHVQQGARIPVLANEHDFVLLEPMLREAINSCRKVLHRIQ